jgi:hypothetical protein
MANALYDKGREKFLTGSISWTTDTIKLVFVTAQTILRTWLPMNSCRTFPRQGG